MKTRREHQIINGVECKYCAKCDAFVNINNFSKNKNTWDGLHCHCFPCKRKASKTSYAANPNPIKEKVKLWTNNNLDRHIEYQKQYQIDNADRIRQLHKEWTENNKDHLKERNKLNKRKRRQKPEYRLLENLRNRLGRAVRGSKSDRTINLIGCDIDMLKTYIERQFQSGMTWDNYGKWHIDHIKPCALFDLTNEEEQRKCFHYTNLQPLWALDNLKKSAKIKT